MTLRVVALHRYPVKSMGGQALTSARVEPRGIAGDRRWLMVTPQGRFLTRRELPVMALLHADPVDGGITLSHRDGGAISVAEPDHAQPLAVQVWGDPVMAHDAGDAAAHWLSTRMGRAVRLVHMPDTAHRPVDPAFGHVGDHVSFADGYPLLVAVVESLDALNARLPVPMPMARFRPNLVIAGASAFAEDGWHCLCIGDVTLRVVKPCTRCVVTTQDPDSGAVTDPLEPLKTLKAMGRVMASVRAEPIFGTNAIPDGPGTITVGDAVALLD
ncbi:MOSC N-terminal beta barrel domain-containing protein [Novosphingobium sp.]|uniref:MOSC domain-containing protein n=1 Tax=Novosphingobium sp. TaxID=1874826 RepID=UPI00333FFB90